MLGAVFGLFHEYERKNSRENQKDAEKHTGKAVGKDAAKQMTQIGAGNAEEENGKQEGDTKPFAAEMDHRGRKGSGDEK